MIKSNPKPGSSRGSGSLLWAEQPRVFLEIQHVVRTSSVHIGCKSQLLSSTSPASLRSAQFLGILSSALAWISHPGELNLSLPRPRDSWQGWLSTPLPRAQVSTCPRVSAWGKTHPQAKTSWKINTREESVISAPRLLWSQEGWGDEASTGQSLALKSLGYTSHRESPSCWWRWRGECLGLLTLGGPREPRGWEGLEGLLRCLLSLAFCASLLTSSDASQK